MSDETTALIERERLSDLIHASIDPALIQLRPALALCPHIIPRASIKRLDHADADAVSPVAVLAVLALLTVMFVSIVQL